MAAWFNRESKGVTTPTEDKREAPDGLWYRCPECKTVILSKTHQDHAYTCTTCNYHEKIGSAEYFSLLFDGNSFTELDENMTSADPLEFVDSKPYPERIKASIKKTNAVLIVEQGAKGTSYGAWLSDEIQRRFFDYLDQPVQRVHGGEASPSISKVLERAAIAKTEEVVAGLKLAAESFGAN
jgi:DNA-directed RNA polymerase subunit M/transcription elongation factor TFIIS